ETGGKSRVITFDGGQFRSNGNSAGADDDRVRDSLLAHLPDTMFLQIAGGGALRRLGTHFRTATGQNYSGPYWSLYAFSPVSRSGISAAHALQQGVFLAFDEGNSLLAEVRIV